MRLLMLIFAFIVFENAKAVEMPDVFSDHMILQREATIPVWGSAGKWHKNKCFVCRNHKNNNCKRWGLACAIRTNGGE